MPQGITFSGLGSGLDTESIIQQLVALERRPIQSLQIRQVELEQEKALYQGINTGLLSLKSAAEDLVDEDLFNIVKASSEDVERVTVAASNEAAAGTFSVEVVSLAEARTLSSRSFPTLDDGLDLSGEFAINGQGIEVAASDTLLDLRDAVNDADAGVSAQILTVSTGDNRLILTAEIVGLDGFDIKDASADDVLQSLGFTSNSVDTKRGFADGAESSLFLAQDEAVGTLLNLHAPPSATVSIGDESVSIDLATDSLEDIRNRINAAAPTGVTASLFRSDDGGLDRYRLEVSGTTDFVDNTGVLEAMGVLDANGSIANEIIGGIESDGFSSTTTAVSPLLGLAGAPSGTVTVAGENLDLDLASQSLGDIQTAINDLDISGVNATITTDTDDDGNSVFRLRLAGSTEVSDDGNVLEALGLVVGSNSTFTSVAQVMTGNVANVERGALKNGTENGANSGVFGSDSDTVGSLVDSTVTGTVTVGDKTVDIDLAVDSLNDVRDKINTVGPTGVTATVVATAPGAYQLQIAGSSAFEDENGVLEALGLLEASEILAASTLFTDIVGAAVADGDTVSISGSNHSGDLVSGTFAITSDQLQVQDLLDEIERIFGGDVTASVDSSGRLTLSDDEAGSSKLDLAVTANNEGGGGLNFGTAAVSTTGVAARSAELQAGVDANVRINGISLSRDTNTITDAVQGVTLDLLAAEEGEIVDIVVTRDDTSELRGKIQSFVNEFNGAIGLIDDQLAVDPKSGKGGPLAGDATLVNLQNRVRTVMTSQIQGLNDGFDALVLIGINFDRAGTLSIDSDMLDEALSNNLEDVRKLFVAQGSTTDSDITYLNSTVKTRSGNYSISLSQAPQQAVLQGTTDLSDGLAADQTVTITDKATGLPAIVELSAADDADAIVSKINTSLSSEVAEVRRGDTANSIDGSEAIDADTTFAEIFGAGVVADDTIRINGTTHSGDNLTTIFTIATPDTQTVGDLLSTIRSAYNGRASVSIDSDGRVVVTDTQVGKSALTVTLIEENEGGGSLNFGSIDVVDEGRNALDITASSEDGQLILQQGGYGIRNGFSVTQSEDQLGMDEDEVEGVDAKGSINGEEADGFGRILSGPVGSSSVEGLSLSVGVSAASLEEDGPQRGEVDLVFGVARLLRDELDFITNTFDGTLQTREGAIDDTIEDLTDQIQAKERRVEQRRLNLVNKFAVLEGSLATMQSDGNFLMSQLASLSN